MTFSNNVSYLVKNINILYNDGTNFRWIMANKINWSRKKSLDKSIFFWLTLCMVWLGFYMAWPFAASTWHSIAAMLPVMERPSAILKSEFVNIQALHLSLKKKEKIDNNKLKAIQKHLLCCNIYVLTFML